MEAAPESPTAEAVGAVALLRALAVPPERERDFFVAATREAGSVSEYARRQRVPIGSMADWAKAAEGAVSELEDFIDHKLVAPFSEMQISVEGTGFCFRKIGREGKAALGEVNERIHEIDKYLEPWQVGSSHPIHSERQELSVRLFRALAEITLFCPDEVLALRQREADLRFIARQSAWSDMANLRRAGQEQRGSFPNRLLRTVTGDAEIQGNRALLKALRHITSVSKPLPEPSDERIAAEMANREAAKGEVLRAHARENA